MEVDQNLSAIKEEPIEIKSETEDELLVGITTVQSIASGQECEDTLGPILGPGVIKIEPTEVDDNVTKNSLGKSQSENESGELVDLSTSHKPKKWRIIQKNGKLEVIKESLSKDGHSESVKLYKCPFCPYTRKRQVFRHIISKHKGDEDVEYFVCHICGKGFKFKDHLTRHVKSHKTIEELMETNEMYTCEQCQKMFRYKASFLKHTKYYHNRNNKPRSKLQCDQCAYTCTSKKYLKYHIQKKHTPLAQLKTLNCPECDFTTKVIAELKEHKYRDHWRSYQCRICPFQTFRQGTLSVHERTHEILQKEEKNFKCDKCDYGTNKLSHLQAHSRKHLKPEEIQYFYCYHCNFKTKWKSCLKAHVRGHFEREEVEFECHICDFKTKKTQIYSRHIGEHNKKLKS